MNPFAFARTYSATLDVQSDVADDMEAALATISADEDVRDRAQLIATELFSNSVEHSCAYDASLHVTIEAWALEGGAVSIRVTDTGAGFDSLPGAELPDDPLAEGGRGLFLIDALAQKVTYEDRGRRVTAEFYPA
jgi:anti-sigma regulatory factor (Ser/Thr protein kinase)